MSINPTIKWVKRASSWCVSRTDVANKKLCRIQEGFYKEEDANKRLSELKQNESNYN